VGHKRATVAAIQMLDQLPMHPVVTVPHATDVLSLTAPPTRKAINVLASLGVLRETNGRQRDRVCAYHEYLRILTGDEA
jgi:hypothetical protein